MSKLVKSAIAVAAAAMCIAVVYVIYGPTPFAGITDTGFQRFVILAIVGLGAFIFVGIVYVYSFKSRR